MSKLNSVVREDLRVGLERDLGAGLVGVADGARCGACGTPRRYSWNQPGPRA